MGEKDSFRSGTIYVLYTDLLCIEKWKYGFKGDGIWIEGQVLQRQINLPLTLVLFFCQTEPGLRARARNEFFT